MSRKFNLSNKWYGGDAHKIFENTYIEFEPGLTVLVGCNGAGKTTLLMQVEQFLRNKEIPVILHNNLTNGEKEAKDNALYEEKIDILAALMTNSEGENIMNVLGEAAIKMGMLSRDGQDAKELWYLFDSIDSGLSIDNISDIKENFLPFVIKENKDKDVYILISANEYEFARNENCLDVMNCKYLKFKDYEDYRDFILKSREQKNKRYG